MAKSTKLNAGDLALLAQAVTARNTGQPIMALPATMKKLVEFPGGPLVESNPAVKDTADPNKIAWRAYPAGVTYLTENSAENPATTKAATVTVETTTESRAAIESDFTLDDGVAIPPLRRGGRGTGKKYPFENMGVGQSFFIAKTDDNPKPSKRIAAVVSTASKNLDPKKFKVQAVVEAKIGGLPGETREGARIWRTA